MFLAASSRANALPADPIRKARARSRTSPSTGSSEYSDKDIEEILTTGMNPDGDNVGGSMAAVVRNTSQLPQSDRAAMAAYIKSLPPVQ